MPDTEIYVIDVPFAMLDEAALRDYLNEMPISFALPDEAFDKLRTAARRIMHASPVFQPFLKDTGAGTVPGDRQGSAPAGAAQAH